MPNYQKQGFYVNYILKKGLKNCIFTGNYAIKKSRSGEQLLAFVRGNLIIYYIK